MSVRVIFSCDHVGCSTTFALDTAKHECDDGACEVAGHPDTDNVPLDLGPVVRFLTDDPTRGGKGWEVAAARLPDGLLLVRKCFCQEHGADIKTMPEYTPDKLAKQHERRKR